MSNILTATAKADLPDILMMPTAPFPGGVATAAMTSPENTWVALVPAGLDDDFAPGAFALRGRDDVGVSG